jgi:hypothetical protein
MAYTSCSLCHMTNTFRKKQAVGVSLLFAAMAAHGEIKVAVDAVDDHRATEKMMSSLGVDLLLSGKEITKINSYKVEIEKAVDDTGKNLINKDRFSSNDDSFSELKKPFGMREAKDDEREVNLRLANPAREAKTISLSGTLFFLNPTADPASSISVKPREHLNQPLDIPALKEAKIKITFKKIEGNTIEYTLSDPSKKFADMEIYDADGKPIERNSWGKYGFAGSQTCSITLKKLPPVFEARLQLVTEKSVIKLPWKLDRVALP